MIRLVSERGVMSAKSEFKKNLKKLMKHQGFKSNEEFGELVGMSASKIQRLSDTSKKNCNGALDLDDADAIATALHTTLGYMTNNPYTSYMLDNTKKMYDYFELRKSVREGLRNALKASVQEDEIQDYLGEILSNVDALNTRKKK